MEPEELEYDHNKIEKIQPTYDFISILQTILLIDHSHFLLFSIYYFVFGINLPTGFGLSLT